ncbi:MAG: putative anion transporting ATPase [Ilumatobacteraceae bacterium]|nr:putative anion transporting ATPase [Ilumatobacteraceae bacterium]
MRALDRIVADAEIVVSCGSGGVGKTTTAAAIALHAASIGRRVVVVTIDPARRLADAFGLVDGLSNEPTPVEVAGIAAGTGAGRLWAMMLDPAQTFDDLVREHASSPERVERILSNSFYRNIAGALSGTQEYMAAEKLFQLHRDDRFDLVVVDTPPTRNALDFLDAPATLTRFINHRLFRLMMLPARSGMKVLNIAAQPVLRTIGKVVGGDVLADAIAFFQAFEGMETGFRDRADAVAGLLHSSVTSYVLVASARHDTVVEARYFAGRLTESNLAVAAVVVNRLQPRFGGATATAATDAADGEADPDRAAMWRNLGELAALADAEERVIAPLVADVPADAVHRVPLLDDDVHDLDGLRSIAAHLFAAGPITAV